jgi:hypothetical protein
MVMAFVPPPQASAQNALYVVSGTVTAGVWGRAGVKVTGGGNQASTGPSGTFRFESSLPGVWFVTAETPVGHRRTQIVILAVPGETVVDFSLPYDVSLLGPGLWDPISTAKGSVTRTLSIVTDAPNPGSPGEAHHSCVSVADSRTGTTMAAQLVGELPGGRWRWEWTLALPEMTPEGSYSIDMVVADCESGGRLTADDSSTRRPYKIDNTPPSVSDPAPTGWVAATTTVGARVVDAAGSLHPDIDDACFRPVELWIDGNRSWTTCFERKGSEERLETPVTGLAQGFHTAEIRASDDAGNKADPLPFSFSVDTHPPALAAPSPVNVIADPSPLIFLGVSDPDSGVDPATVVMRLSNGVVSSRLDATYDSASGRIDYQVPDEFTGPRLGGFPLPDGTYRVEVDVRDQVGNLSTVSWSFEVRTLAPAGVR